MMEKNNNRAVFAGIILTVALLSLSGTGIADYMDLLWNYSTKAPVVSVYVDDINNDDFKEIIAASSEYTIKGDSAGWLYLLDRDGGLKWKYETTGAVSAMAVGDLKGDGKKQVITGVSFSMSFVDADGQSQKLYIPDHLYRVESIIMDDIDMDGNKELIVSAGSTDKGKIFVYNSNKNLVWTAQTLGETSAAYVADINNDKFKEVIVGSIGQHGIMGYPGKVYAFNYKGQQLWKHDTATGVASISADDVDGDGQGDVLVGCQNYFYVLSNEGQQKTNSTTGGRIRKIVVADLDGDGNKEVILGSNDIYVLNRDYSKRWINKAGIEAYDVDVEDINSDGNLEILVAAEKLFFIDKDGNDLGNYARDSTRFSLTSLYVTDINEDSYPEVVTGSVDGNVYVLQPNVYSKKFGAQRLLENASNHLVAGIFEQARKETEDAKKLFEEAGDSKKVREANDMLKKIAAAENKTLSERAQADAYYSKASESFLSRDYMSAYTNAQRAKSGYQSASINDMEYVKRCNDIIMPSLDAIKSDAEDFYANATSAYEEKDYEKASILAQNATDYYVFLKDEVGAQKSGELAAKISQDSGKTEKAEPEKVDFLSSALRGLSGMIPGADPLHAALVALIVLSLIVAVILAAKRLRRERKKEARGHKKSLAKMHAEEPASETFLDDMEKESREKEDVTLHKHPQKQAERTEKRDGDNLFLNMAPCRSTVKHGAERKHLPRIMKDRFRGEGVSLRDIACRITEGDIKD